MAPCLLKQRSIIYSPWATLLLLILFAFPFSAHAQVPVYVPTVSLQAWYPFNGNARNEAAPGRNGSVLGAVLTTDRFGNPGSAYHFNGTTSHIAIDSAFFNTGWRDFTISCWLNSDSFTNSKNTAGTQVMINTIPYDGVALNYNYLNSFKYSVWAGTVPGTSSWNILANATSVDSVSVRQWVHIALVKKNGLSWLLYINGKLDTTFTTSAITPNHLCRLVLGRSDSSASNQTFLGKLDDYGIWNRALLPCEISQLYRATAGPDPGSIIGPTNVCSGATVTLSGSVGGGTWESSNTSIATITPTGVLWGGPEGQDTIRYTITNACGTATVSQTITVVPIPSVGIIKWLSTMCAGASAVFTNVTTSGTWSSGNTAIATIGSASGQVQTHSAGVAMLTFTPSSSANCNNAFPFFLTVIPAPDFRMAYTVSPVLCYGFHTGSIISSVSGGIGPFKNAWSNGDSAVAIHSLATGSYHFNITEVSTQCKMDTDLVVTGPDSLLLTASLTNDSCRMGSGAIAVTVAGGVSPYTFQWSNNGVGDHINHLPAGNYTVTVTDKNNCAAQSPYIIENDTCIRLQVHDVITPNGDGLNDTWIIEGLQLYPKNVVRIFSKLGDMLYEQAGYSNDWAGKSDNGLQLPDGTYYYLVQLRGASSKGSDVLKGSILIKR